MHVICPHCSTGVNIEWFTEMGYRTDPDDPAQGAEIRHGQCPVCWGVIVKIVRGQGAPAKYSYSIERIESEEVVFPKYALRAVEPEVPDKYKNDFHEACAVLHMSPKASAAVSRRLLQDILREEFNIEHRSLAQEIEEFIQLQGIPSHLSGAIDAIKEYRQFRCSPFESHPYRYDSGSRAR